METPQDDPQLAVALDGLDEPQPTNPDGSLILPPADEPAPPPDDSPAPSPADDAKGTGRFAVYDKDERRFRGRVHETRKAADDLKGELSKPKRVRRGRYEVREV